MADDKTAAERAAEEQWPIHGGGVTDTRVVPDLLRYRACFVQGAAWQAEQAAARGVAPDRETREKLRAVVAGDVLGGANEHHCIENQGCTVCAGNRAVDAVLASDVLGAPAEPNGNTGKETTDER